MNCSMWRRGLVAITAAGSLALTAGCAAANEGGTGAAGGNSGNTGKNSSGGAVSGTVSGAGASSQAAAVQAWKAGFEGAHAGSTVNYDPVGSGGGRQQFLAGGVQFAGSDAALTTEELARVPASCGQPIEFPVYVSPIAVAYNLPGVPELRLSPALIAKIFDQRITRWNDPAIRAENPGADLPDTAVTAVNRSDESGTTENFTEYLAATAKNEWKHEPSGEWPVPGGTAAKGTSGVVEAVGANVGSVGYADESQIGDLRAALVKVGDDYTKVSAEGAAKVVDASERVGGRGEHDYAIKLRRNITDRGTYPIVLVSYELACTRYADPQQAALVKAWLTYIAGEEGQRAAQGSAGNAPLSSRARQNAQRAIDAIG